ncbi:DUF2381 family protein [Corallococcus sp. Z5C101001]|uniref:DUF2381 family protein n=1 Tax=Corallococcus sp. Z5C101001 TaxID=2596829 RepID=UPI00163D4D38|nr:DUF2381 family protein [Corallococcus sp. Z5C101001]
MPSCLSVALPVLLWSTCVLAAPLDVGGKGEGILRMEVGPEHPGVRPIRIGAGVSTTLLFDSDIVPDQVSLEGRAQFSRVSMGSAVVVLIPSDDLRQGEVLKLSIPFKDTTLPPRVVLTLQVQADAVDRQVEVYRRARSAESYRQEVGQLRAELERLRLERKQPPAAAPGVDGFRGLLAGSTAFPGLTVRRELGAMRCVAPCPLRIDVGALFVSGQRRALRLSLRSADKEPWRVGRAVLVDAQGHEWESLTPVQSALLTVRSAASVIVEFEMPADISVGPYSLRLWDTAGKRVAQFGDVPLD